MYNKIIYTLLLGIFYFPSCAQSKWKGGSDGLWRSPVNWTDNVAPIVLPDRDIVLDNSVYPDSYIVRITTNDSILIHSLTIAPDRGKTITLIIDSFSTRRISLTVVSADQGIFINHGGGLINASKAIDGDVIKLADSLYLNNGSMYSHQTRRSHNEIVNRLSRSVGTEEGIFEFNIPAASTTLSLSNRHYGSLYLSSSVYGKNCTYSGGATSPLYIRGDLKIDKDVAFTVNFSDTIFIGRNYIQKGGSFNLANSTRTPVIAIAGNMQQEGGEIIRTGAVFPVLLFNGKNLQSINTSGVLPSNLIIKCNSALGIVLGNALTIPYRLELIKGVLFTSTSNLLTLSSKGVLIADSTTHLSYINGPVKKEGLVAKDNFLFPVGKNNMHRWLCLKNATGDFIVEYVREDPRAFSDQMDVGLHHISAFEYWVVKSDVVAKAAIHLSFNQNSGGVSDLPTLRVAKWSNGEIWKNAGNTGTLGIAEQSGSITSGLMSGFNESSRFTLASSTVGYNVLPIHEDPPTNFSRPDARSKYGIRSVSASYNVLKCTIYADIPRTVQLELVDMNGRRMLRSTNALLKGKNMIYFNRFDLPAGVYIMRMTEPGGSAKPAFYGTHRFFVLRQ